MTVSNVSYWGSNQSIGTFENAEAIVGFDTGIMLSSGFISAAAGPNTSDRTTSDSDEEDRNGDADLDTLTSAPTVDAAALQLTFVPQSDTITFRYVFGSEEYNENVGTDFNDVFAFYVNGQNYALLPDGEPVTINSVNAERNSDLYIDNEMQAAGGGRDTELDGLTTVLTFTAPVNPNQDNILKLVIADVDDNLLDSVVFIEGNSLRAAATEPPPPPPPPVSPDPTATNVVSPTTQETVTPGVTPATTPTTPAGGIINNDGIIITLSPEEAMHLVGQEGCLVATVRNESNQPIDGVQVDFSVTGENATGGSVTSGPNGQTEPFCYTGDESGSDRIVATAGTASASATKTWINWLFWLLLGLGILTALFFLLLLLRRSKSSVKPVLTDDYETGNPPPRSAGQSPSPESEPTGTGGVDIHGETQGQGGQGGVSRQKKPGNSPGQGPSGSGEAGTGK
jgi:hypothetical protein